MSFDIWAVVRDPGGMSGILPVVEELRTNGHTVLLIANGKGAELLGRTHSFVPCTDASELLRTHSLPKVLITDMSAEGGVGRDLVPLVKGGVTTVAFQDMWGAHLCGSWAGSAYRPDHIVVNDELGRDVVLEAWPDFKLEQVLVTGFPALDKYASFNVASKAAAARKVLGLESDVPVVFFAGQGACTGHALEETVATLTELDRKCYFLPRPHPRMSDAGAEEMVRWQKALGGFSGRLILDWFNHCSHEQLVALAAERGVVVSMYSTVLLQTAALRGCAVAVLYPDTGLSHMRKSLRPLRHYPLVELGYAHWAQDRRSLRFHLAQALADKPAAGEATPRKTMSVDGRNAFRAMEKITALL